MKLDFVVKATDKIKDVAGVTGLKIQKASPEILLGVGIGCILVGTVAACKATRDLDEVIEPIEADILDIKEDNEAGHYEKAEYTKELAKTYIFAGKSVAKLYAPAFLLITGGICCMLKGHDIMKKRNLALIAAYNTLNDGYSKYRERVAAKYGKDVDEAILHGYDVEDIEYEYTDENGKHKKKKIKNAKVLKDVNTPSPYARFFGPGYCENPEVARLFSAVACGNGDYDHQWLIDKQDIWNRKLRRRGYVMLHEVYEDLGFEPSEASFQVGWLLGNGDDQIEFGMTDAYIRKDAPEMIDGKPVIPETIARWQNGYEPVILLDFNVDGVIIDKISQQLGIAQI